MSREEITPRNDRERRALGEIAEIDNTRGHPAHDPGRPGHQAAFAHYQALWKLAIGDRDTKVVSYREAGDPVVER